MRLVTASVLHVSLDLLLGLALALCLDPGHARAARSHQPSALGFKGANIGMSLEEWRAVPIPQGAGDAPEQQCSNEYRVAKIPGVALGDTEVKRGVVACTYVARFGQTILPHSVRLDPGFEAQNLNYLFAHGRLFEIRYKASVDAYPYLQGMLSKAYGKPIQVVVRRGARAKVRHLRETWRVPGGSVTLDNPSTDLPTLLSVRYAAAARRPRL